MQPSGKSKDNGIPYDKIDIEPLDTPDSKISEVWFPRTLGEKTHG